MITFSISTLFLVYFCSVVPVMSKESGKPNIVIILADDLGWNDVGFHDSKMFSTPNIDALAYNGVILNNFYSSSLCTPSRSALMTGKFPIFTGMQHSVLLEAEPSGLPLDLKILPQYMKSAGYDTHLVGKWHLGFFSKNYTPNARGFDSFFGYYQGHQDYFTHRAHETLGPFDGYDLHDDLATYWEMDNIYGTDLYTAKAVDIIRRHDENKPLFLTLAQIATHSGENSSLLQAPQDAIDNFEYIDDTERRVFAAMVSKLDESVGEIVNVLNERNMLENTIIVFMADNGAPTFGMYSTTGSNYPFRGMKDTELEGGTHLVASIWSPLLKNQQRVSNLMMHMVDFLPTLCAAAGIDLGDESNIDGISMWEALLQGSEISPRTEFTYNIDPAEPSINASGAVRVGDWKYFKGSSNFTGEKYQWVGDKYGTLSYPGVSDNYEVIFNSAVNQIISNFYLEAAQWLSSEITDKGYVTQSPLTLDKIQQLKKDSQISCTTLPLPACDPTSDCLLNLREDPCERYNFAQTNPTEYEMMKNKFEQYRAKVVAPINKPSDPCANPALWGDQWVNWYDFEAMVQHGSLRGTLDRWYNDYVSYSYTLCHDYVFYGWSHLFPNQ